MSEKRILNSWKEIANYLQVHEQTAVKLGAELGLPHAKIGGSVFTTVNALEKWVLEAIIKKSPEPENDENTEKAEG